MENEMPFVMTKAEADEMKALLADFVSKAEAANRRMDQTEAEIEQLKQETRAMLRNLQLQLNLEVTYDAPVRASC